jgi:hypothetical protein
VRFKRPASEAGKDGYREGNPFSTVSQASGPGCGSVVLLVAALGAGCWYWLA